MAKKSKRSDVPDMSLQVSSHALPRVKRVRPHDSLAIFDGAARYASPHQRDVHGH